MIVASRSGSVVLVGSQIVGDSLVSAAAYVNALPDTVVQLFDVSPSCLEIVDLGFWKLPKGGYSSGAGINPVIVLSLADRPGT